MGSQLRGIVIAAAVSVSAASCGGGSSPPPVPPTATLTSSATDVGISGGPSITLSWSSTYATSCTASGAWSGTLGPSGSQSIVVPQTSTYTISCSGRGGLATASVTIQAWVPPAVSLTADRGSVMPNGTVRLTWSSQHTTECHGFLGSPGAMPAVPTSGSQTTAPLTRTTRFQIICGNPIYRAGIAEVAVVVAPKFTVIALPMERAVDLNAAGEVMGQRASVAGTPEVVVWIEGANAAVLGCPDPQNCPLDYSPAAMNSSRTVIGMVSGRKLQPGIRYYAGFRWQVGEAAESPVALVFPQTITDINDAGQIVGGNEWTTGAMLYSDGNWVLLFSAIDLPGGVATAINNAGHVTGWMRAGDGTERGFLYVDGNIQDLGMMNGAAFRAEDINMADHVVGSAGGRAFLYANSRFTDLGTLGGDASSASGINDVDQVVGTTTLAGPDPQAQRAFLQLNGTMYDLNELVEPLPAPLIEARKINNRGQVIANTCCRAYLLTPVSPP